ncbi:MAG TPA: FAD-binding oxidoreductase [Acidimicrobiales bacterium]|nr:FAD-binding oxidoreductase [Acidimicrobiales bacterium]
MSTVSDLLAGWGRTSPTSARVSSLGRPDEVQQVLAGAGTRGVIGRGLGRSYGDAAQNAGGDVAVMTGLDRILDVDVEAATATVEAGVSLDRLMRTLVPMGLWPAVTPGTRQVTVGGAIGSDVHGKNHHRDGTFGSHVRSMELVSPAAGPLTLTPDGTPEEFWATTGGMGLTGLIRQATIDLFRIETGFIRVDSERTADLDTTMSLMAERDSSYRYSVAWIDCLARGGSLGRSIVEFGEHARRQDLPPAKRSADRALRFTPLDSVPAPPWVPSGLLNRWTVAAFNELWYRKAPKRAEGHVVPAASFFHPLDLVAGWNRIYGDRGFLQYQFVLPDGAEATLRRIIEELVAHRCASFLAVLKRFGPSNPAPLSFPRPGWTLALDLPVTFGELAGLLDTMDEQVVAAGGRIYLAKDSRLRPEFLETMYPRLPEWREVRDRLDPEHRMRSDLLRRLPALAGGSSAPSAPSGSSASGEAR